MLIEVTGLLTHQAATTDAKLLLNISLALIIAAWRAGLIAAHDAAVDKNIIRGTARCDRPHLLDRSCKHASGG